MLTAYDYPDGAAPRRGRHPAPARRRFARPGDARLRDRPSGSRWPRCSTTRRPWSAARRGRWSSPTCRSCPTRRPTRRSRTPGIFLREAGAQAVKVEGGVRSARIIEALVRAGIPVMGHIGLTPQSINTIGKVRVQGKNRDQARALLADAQAVQEAGAFAIVLELVPEQLAAAITERLRIPTIGIGAGAGCSGQVQVITDLLGLGDFVPAARPAVRRPARDDPRGGDGLRSGRRGGHVPGSGRDRPDGRRGPRRGPRARLPGPAGRVDPGRRHPARPRPLSATLADAPPGSPDGRP